MQSEAMKLPMGIRLVQQGSCFKEFSTKLLKQQTPTLNAVLYGSTVIIKVQDAYVLLAEKFAIV